MTTNDPISNFLSNLKNHAKANKTEMYNPYSKFIACLASLLTEEGYIRSYKIEEKDNKKSIIIFLRNKLETNYITKINILSKPSRRVYVRHCQLSDFRTDGLTVISTSTHGLISLAKALKLQCGGELLCWIG